MTEGLEPLSFYDQVIEQSQVLQLRTQCNLFHCATTFPTEGKLVVVVVVVEEFGIVRVRGC
jgi:hypothetical protein